MLSASKYSGLDGKNSSTRTKTIYERYEIK
jgi:hypothetical protein